MTRRDWAIAFALGAVSIALYAPAMQGEFVYDDQVQIVGNDLIQRPQFWGRALRSDVFAFKTELTGSWHAYYRPTFVAWLIANYAAFGRDPFWWHASVLLVHGCVCVLLYLLFRRQEFSEFEAGAATAIFAAHPAHVESVAWVSGVTDPLLALFLLLSLHLLRRPGALYWALAAGSYALALGTKETAILFPVVVWFWAGRRVAIGAALMAGAFLLVRASVLGAWTMSRQPLTLTSLKTLLCTLPALGFEYVKQSVLPWTVAPAYPFRPLSGIPFAALAALLIAGIAVYWLARRDRRAWWGLLLFAVPLVPAMNILAYPPDDILHDRYLYLSIAGVALLAVIALRRVPKPAVALITLALAFQTVRYSRVWASEDKLFAAAIASDPASGLHLHSYARAMIAKKRYGDARAAIDRAIVLRPSDVSYLTRAEIYFAEGRFAEAVPDIQTVIDRYPAHFGAVERMAIVYERMARWDDALGVLRGARERIPSRYAALTAKIGVVLIQAGRRQEALRELESVRARGASEQGQGGALALLYLAKLYQEEGRLGEAGRVMREYEELKGR